MTIQRESTITHLQQELDRLEIAAHNIRLIILDLKQQGYASEEDFSPDTSDRKDSPPKPLPKIPFVQDRYGTTIKLGNRVAFLTKGRIPATHGRVDRFSRNGERVYAKDSNGKEIARAPENLRVYTNDDEQRRK